MKGWFDAFRYDGGPTLYSFNNRTAVTGDVTIITFLIIFCTLYVAFLIIYPGIRKERFTTFFTVTLSLFTGATILVSLFGSGWHVGHASIVSSYKAFSKEKVVADIGVYVGLNHVNITLQATPAFNASVSSPSDIDFNERFYWLTSDQMGDSFKDALFKGLPYPILTVAEYFSLGQEGLSWGGQYRAAGYYAIIMLWTCFALWLLMNLMLIVVPRYGAVLMTAVGIFLLSTVSGYLGMLPDNPLTIHLEGRTLYFHLGWCFWLVFTAGCVCLLSGVIITTTEIIFPNSFSTILEVDYDTPYDRHIIIEDSHGRRFQKKRASSTKLEDPPGLSFGSRLLRRLSSKTPEKILEKRSSTSTLNKSAGAAATGSASVAAGAGAGVDNQAFEMEPRKSSWQYPFRQRHSLPEKKLSRTISHDSLSTRLSREVPSIHKEFTRLRNNSDKIHEVSMW